MKEIKKAIKKKEIEPIRMDNMEWKHAIIAVLSTNEMKEELKKKNKEGIIRKRQKRKVKTILTHVSKKQGPYMVDEAQTCTFATVKDYFGVLKWVK